MQGWTCSSCLHHHSPGTGLRWALCGDRHVSPGHCSYGVPRGCQAGVIWGNRQEVAVAGTSRLHFRPGSGPRDQIPAPLCRCLASPSGQGTTDVGGTFEAARHLPPWGPFGAALLGFVPLSVPYRGWASLGMRQLPPAHIQAVIHRQEVSSWRSLPDLQVGLVPMGTVESRQVRPWLPPQLLGTEQGWQSRGTEHTPMPGAARSQGQAGATQGRSWMGGRG